MNGEKHGAGFQMSQPELVSWLLGAKAVCPCANSSPLSHTPDCEAGKPGLPGGSVEVIPHNDLVPST